MWDIGGLEIWGLCSVGDNFGYVGFFSGHGSQDCRFFSPYLIKPSSRASVRKGYYPDSMQP